MEIIGFLKMVGNTKQVSDTFVTREFVITTEEQYPQHISIQLVQNSVDLIDPYKLGNKLKVSINLRGREWVNPQGETVYFNTIQGWRIEKTTAEAPANSTEIPPVAPAQAFEPAQNVKEEDHDDLPF